MAERSWKETSPGIWSRPLDSLESILHMASLPYLQANIEQFAIVVSLQLNLSPTLGDPIAALRHAWTTMRHKHPDIATTLSADFTTKTYTVPTPSDLSTWLSSTFIVSSAPSAQALNSTLGPHPLPRLFYLPTSSTILVRISHWRIDGIGCELLLRSLLHSLANPTPPYSQTPSFSPSRLAPSMDAIFSAPTSPSPALVSAANRMLDANFSSMPHVGVPISHPSATAPRGVRHLTHRISAPFAAKLLAACKTHNLALTGAVHAALLHTVYALCSPRSRARPAGMTVPYNARPWAGAPYDGHEYPVMVCFANTLFALAPGEGGGPGPGEEGFFMYVAGVMSRKYRARLDRAYPGEGDPGFLEYNAVFVEGYKGALVEMAMRGTGEREGEREAQVWLSSLGRLDGVLDGEGVGLKGKGVEGVRVEWSEFCLQLELGTDDLTMHLWGEGDELRLGATWNEAYWEEKDVEVVVGKIMECLEKELVGISEV